MCGGIARVDRPLPFPLALVFDDPPDDESEVSNPFLLFDIVAWGSCISRSKR